MQHHVCVRTTASWFATQPGIGCVIETSTNRLDWRPFRTNTATSFTLDFEDPDASKFPRGFYRARWSEVLAVAHSLTSH